MLTAPTAANATIAQALAIASRATMAKPAKHKQRSMGGRDPLFAI